MFRLMPKSEGYLFASRELRELLDERRSALREEVESLEANRLLNTVPADLLVYLEEKWRLIAPTLRRAETTAAEAECQVDVSGDRGRYFSSRGGSHYVPGQRITIEIPLDGEAELFYCRPSAYTSTLPRGVVQHGTLQLTWDVPHDSNKEIKGDIDRAITNIEEYLGWVRADVESFNGSLGSLAEQAIEARRSRLLANQGRVASLGIPLKVRGDAPKTYAAPGIQRKVLPTMPPASSAPFVAEPTMDTATYDHILSVIENMTHVIERSPSAFSTMKEEDLRQHFLVQLNGHYEGQATGETFNANGKTDILVRSGDKNIFIAECKFWKGAKQFAETVDQLLGYAAWRDTKAAILVFNRGRDTTKVMDSVRESLPKHGNFKRDVDWSHETGIRCVLHHPGDANRELILTVLVFDVPGDATSAKVK